MQKNHSQQGHNLRDSCHLSLPISDECSVSGADEPLHNDPPWPLRDLDPATLAPLHRAAATLWYSTQAPGGRAQTQTDLIPLVIWCLNSQKLEYIV